MTCIKWMRLKKIKKKKNTCQIGKHGPLIKKKKNSYQIGKHNPLMRNKHMHLICM